ncbi:MAG: sigma-54-dependent Fis family transcriptional regulator [Spirochaetales bacterium]|nr:sigma-54-dependent Fis family transcriptional regulator [Spirochaetales bacterium]
MGGFSNSIGVQDSRKALNVIERHGTAVILLDLAMPHLPGDKLLPLIQEAHPELPVIIITGNTELSTAVDCMRNGAFDYLVKPFESAKLIATVKRAVEILELRQENQTLKEHLVSNELDHPEAFKGIVTGSDKMRAVLLYAEAIAGTAQTVLVTGETGVGKELIAAAVHKLSGRDGELVAVNVSGFDDSMFSDTLFGHKKGAFTGADSPRKGLVESAAGGTLFLDEIGDLSKQSQVKLLRLLESREYLPLGSDVKKKSNARVVVATNRDLLKASADGEFRRDLYYRLSTHIVSLPPLRERTEDLPQLIKHFTGQVIDEFGVDSVILPLELARFLSGYSFPGNVRELRSLIFDAVSRSLVGGRDKSSIHVSLDAFKAAIGEDIEDVPDLGDGDGLLTFHDKLPTIKVAMELLINEAMARAGGTQTLAAKMLGISQQALSKRLRG